MKKTFNIVNIILITLVLVLASCYTALGGLWIKSLASAGFVVLMGVNLIYALKIKTDKWKFSIVMLVGHVFSMVGDIVLNIEFMIGAIIFAVGHIFYFVAYCFLNRFKWIDLIPGTVIFVPSALVITLVPLFDFGGIFMKIVCVVYALVISLMLGKAISNLVRDRNCLNIILVIGSFLFFFSDLMLLFDVFGSGMSPMAYIIFDTMCLATYYPAQCVLGYSLMLLPKSTEKSEI